MAKEHEKKPELLSQEQATLEKRLWLGAWVRKGHALTAALVGRP